MYSKSELQNKSLEELQAIADEYGISSNKKDHAALMYDIIDHESVSAAQKATDKPKKRSRIKTVDLVYSANQLKAKRLTSRKLLRHPTPYLTTSQMKKKRCWNNLQQKPLNL